MSLSTSHADSPTQMSTIIVFDGKRVCECYTDASFQYSFNSHFPTGSHGYKTFFHAKLNCYIHVVNYV